MFSIKENRRNKQIFIGIHKAPETVRRGLRRAFFEIGRENVKYTRNLILDKNKTGRIYRIKGAIHRASAPGEAPANFSGTLQRSIAFNLRGWRELEFGDKEHYGKFLEDGTKNMEARQHLGKTVTARQMDVVRTIATTVHEELRR